MENDARQNLLEIPSRETAETRGEYRSAQVAHRLAKLLLRPEAFPVERDAEKSTHPIWRDYSEVAKLARMEHKPTIVKVFSIAEITWMEFSDTYSPNDEYEGFVGEVERSDGWTGRYSIKFTLGDSIRYLLESD